MIKAHKKYICVCHLCEQLRTRAHTHTYTNTIPEVRETGSNDGGLVKEKEIENPEFEIICSISISIYEVHYFCSILICITRLDVKMNILVFFNNSQ
jgi:hypothetical protein